MSYLRSAFTFSRHARFLSVRPCRLDLHSPAAAMAQAARGSPLPVPQGSRWHSHGSSRRRHAQPQQLDARLYPGSRERVCRAAAQGPPAGCAAAARRSLRPVRISQQRPCCRVHSLARHRCIASFSPSSPCRRLLRRSLRLKIRPPHACNPFQDSTLSFGCKKRQHTSCHRDAGSAFQRVCRFKQV